MADIFDQLDGAGVSVAEPPKDIFDSLEGGAVQQPAAAAQPQPVASGPDDRAARYQELFGTQPTEQQWAAIARFKELKGVIDAQQPWTPEYDEILGALPDKQRTELAQRMKQLDVYQAAIDGADYTPEEARAVSTIKPDTLRGQLVERERIKDRSSLVMRQIQRGARKLALEGGSAEGAFERTVAAIDPSRHGPIVLPREMYADHFNRTLEHYKPQRRLYRLAKKIIESAGTIDPKEPLRDLSEQDRAKLIGFIQELSPAPDERSVFGKIGATVGRGIEELLFTLPDFARTLFGSKEERQVAHDAFKLRQAYYSGDIITGDNMFSQGLYDVAGMVPAVAASYATGGPLRATLAVWWPVGTQDLYNDVRSAGVSDEFARPWSIGLGLAYGAVETLQLQQMGLGHAKKKAQREAFRSISRFVLAKIKEAPALWTREMAEEWVQGAIKIGNEAIVRSLDEDVPEIDWKKQIAGLGEEMKRAALPLAYMMIAGVGVQAAKAEITRPGAPGAAARVETKVPPKTPVEAPERPGEAPKETAAPEVAKPEKVPPPPAEAAKPGAEEVEAPAAEVAAPEKPAEPEVPGVVTPDEIAAMQLLYQDHPKQAQAKTEALSTQQLIAMDDSRKPRGDFDTVVRQEIAERAIEGKGDLTTAQWKQQQRDAAPEKVEEPDHIPGPAKKVEKPAEPPAATEAEKIQAEIDAIDSSEHPKSLKSRAAIRKLEARMKKMETAEKAESISGRYPTVGDTVDGREVLDPDNVPNMDSISATLNDYEILPGVREVPMSDFTLTGKHYSVQGTSRIKTLSDTISKNDRIAPLIVVLEADGPYILEGATRAEALFRLGAKSFPAVVVVNKENPPVAKEAKPKPAKPKALGQKAREAKEVRERDSRIKLLLDERQRILNDAKAEREDSIGGDFAHKGRRKEIQAQITEIDKDLKHQGYDAALPSLAKFLKAKVAAEPAAPAAEEAKPPKTQPPRAEVAAEEAPAEEPWQMSAEEFRKAYPIRRSPGANKGFRHPLITGKAYSNAQGGYIAARAEVVEKAVAEGKPVPAEVLAEYPELADKPKAPGGQAMAAAGTGEGYGTVQVSERNTKGGKARSVAAVTEDIDTKATLTALDELLKLVAPSIRGDVGREGARATRTALAELARKSVVVQRSLRKAHRAFSWMSRADAYEFIDNMENGKPQANPKLDAIAAKLRELMDGRRDRIQAMGKGYLQSYYENYFPHIWKNQKKAKGIIAAILGKRPIQGSKAFLKKRTIMTVKEGIEHELQLLSDNPIDLVMMKVHEMDRFTMAQDLIQDLKDRGLLKFVYVRSQGPAGWAKVNDYAFTVFMPPQMTILEAFDQTLVDNLIAFAKSLNIDTARVMKMGQKWGYALGKEKVRTKFAGPEAVLVHEIGHIIGNRYDLFEELTRKHEGQYKDIKRGKKKGLQRFVPTPEAVEARKTINIEWRALADARIGDESVSEGFRKYVRKGAEKEAVLFEAMIHAPSTFKEVAPTLYKLFRKFLNDHAELRPMLDIAPSLVIGAGTGTIDVPGVTELGKFWAPEPVALLLNNHLSPGVRGSGNQLVSGTYDLTRIVGNTMNQANLSLSLFHGLNTTTDVMASYMGVAMREILASKTGQLRGLGKILRVPTSPMENLWRGDRLLRAYSKPLSEIKDPKLRKMVELVVYAGGRARLDSFYHNHAVKSLVKTIREIAFGSPVAKVKGVVRLPFNTVTAGLEIVAKPVLEWLVPRQKLGLFAMMANHELLRAKNEGLSEEQTHQRLTEVWDNVDNRMGQLVYDNLFWNKTLKDVAMLTTRSVGWNLGSWREYGGAPIDFFTTRGRMGRGDAWLSQKIGYAAGAVAVYSILGAIAMYLMTGRWPDEYKDYFFPKTGYKNPDGSDERLSLPTYAKDWWAYAEDPWRTIGHKIHPLWQTLGDTWANEDFYGTEIRNEDDPLVKQFLDFGEYVGKQFIPFSVRNYGKMRKAGEPATTAAVTSLTGIQSAPSYLTRTVAQKLMSKYIVAKIPRGTRTKEQFDRSQLRKRLRDSARAGADIRTSEALAVFTNSELRRIEKEAKLEPFAGSFKRLSFGEALNVYNVATDKERAQALDILRGKHSRAKKSGSDWPDKKQLYETLTREK